MEACLSLTHRQAETKVSRAMEYDEQFLVKAADRFEQQARALVYQVATRYAVFAFISSYVFARGLDAILSREMVHPLEIPPGTIVLIVTAAALAAGILVGKNRAFLLRVEAHKLLALVAIHRQGQNVVTLEGHSVAFATDPKMLPKSHA